MMPEVTLMPYTAVDVYGDDGDYQRISSAMYEPLKGKPTAIAESKKETFLKLSIDGGVISDHDEMAATRRTN